MITSQTKTNRRRCIKAISENTIIVMVVNGFMIRSLLFHKVVNITYLFPLALHSFIKYITGASFRKHKTETGNSERRCILCVSEIACKLSCYMEFT
jgi:hypothetical protein